MKKTKLLFIAVFMVFSATNISAQYTPESGSAERKAIMDALRIPVKRELKKPVIFQVGNLQVKDGWAVISASFLNPNGGEFDWSGTKYEASWRRGDLEGGVQALLKKSGKIWKVITYEIDATDYGMGYACSKRKGCPKELQN